MFLLRYLLRGLGPRRAAWPGLRAQQGLGHEFVGRGDAGGHAAEEELGDLQDDACSQSCSGLIHLMLHAECQGTVLKAVQASNVRVGSRGGSRARARDLAPGRGVRGTRSHCCGILDAQRHCCDVLAKFRMLTTQGCNVSLLTSEERCSLASVVVVAILAPDRRRGARARSALVRGLLPLVLGLGRLVHDVDEGAAPSEGDRRRQPLRAALQATKGRHSQVASGALPGGAGGPL
mmetsp:Transcript_115149/g.365880  ORF Transcript_115149/g.365880 Transcript_115149/m.365880 type:complete len:234 (-) Transcript_115149:18-719(-)